MLGINNYGNREISKKRYNQEEKNLFFSEIFLLRIILVFLVLLVFLFFYIFLIHRYQIIFLIQSFMLLNCIIDCNWFFYGLEEFKKITIRNIVCKLVFLFSVFLFVKSEKDLINYVILNVAVNIVGNLLMIPDIIKNIKFTKIKFKSIFKHLKPLFILFIPVLSLSLYRQIDKIMIINYFGETNEGYYEFADKVIHVLLMTLTAISTILMPRMTTLMNQNKIKEANEVFLSCFKLNCIVSFAFSFGLAAVSRQFAPLYFGESYIITGDILFVLSFSIIFTSLSNIIRAGLMIPKNLDVLYIVLIIFCLIINVILNIILMKHIGVLGAALSTLIAEMILCILHILCIKNYISNKTLFKIFFKYLLIGSLMFFVVSLINVNSSPWINLLVKIFVGVIVYCFFILISYLRQKGKKYE